jgi:hypothetical protein
LAVSASAEDLGRLRRQFDREHMIRLPGLLDAEHLDRVHRYVDELGFQHRVHEGIGTEFCLPDGRAVRLLFYLVNDPAFFDLVNRLTGCGRIGCFTGRVYRMVPGSGDYDTWHDDAIQHRLIGMSINLGAEVYEGGMFQLRDAATRQILCDAPNVGAGDAILFRIDRRLEHWITPLEGTAPKTAFAGWFRSAPEFLSLLERDPAETSVEPEW